MAVGLDVKAVTEAWNAIGAKHPGMAAALLSTDAEKDKVCVLPCRFVYCLFGCLLCFTCCLPCVVFSAGRLACALFLWCGLWGSALPCWPCAWPTVACVLFWHAPQLSCRARVVLGLCQLWQWRSRNVVTDSSVSSSSSPACFPSSLYLCQFAPPFPHSRCWCIRVCPRRSPPSSRPMSGPTQCWGPWGARAAASPRPRRFVLARSCF